MTTDRDPDTRIVLSWLREDAREDAERVLLRALDEVDTTPQHGRLWSVRRFADMNAYAKLGIAAAAVVVVAVAGVQLLPRTGFGGGQPTATPGPTASPSHPPLATGPLQPGRYAFTWSGPRTSLEVPAGWTGTSPMSIEKGAAGADVGWGGWSGPVTQVFSDACHEGTLVKFDGTRDGLADALDAQLNTDATATGITLAGETGTRVDLVPSPGLDMATCSEGADGPLKIWHEDDSGYYALYPGARGIVVIFEYSYGLVVYTGVTGSQASASDLTELEAVIASTRIGPKALQ